jgi:hypothetical protein
MKFQQVVGLMALVLTTATACGVSSSDVTPGVTMTPTATPTVASQAPEQICRNALGAAVLLGWAPGTVAEFRAYQYGGPTATVPLADAFPGVPANTRGAWCGTKEGTQSTHWWAAIPGQTAGTLFIIHGAGEGIRLGSVTGPPRIP